MLQVRGAKTCVLSARIGARGGGDGDRRDAAASTHLGLSAGGVGDSVGTGARRRGRGWRVRRRRNTVDPYISGQPDAYYLDYHFDDDCGPLDGPVGDGSPDDYWRRRCKWRQG